MRVRVDPEEGEVLADLQPFLSENRRRTDALADDPDALWAMSTEMREHGYAFLSACLVGLRLKGASDGEINTLTAFVLATLDDAEGAIRAELERREEYRIDDEEGSE